MFSLRKRNDGPVTHVEFFGPIDEATDFATQIGSVDGEIHVKCSHVTRMNSVGIKSWMLYFNSLHRAGKRIVYLECSPALVSVVNMLSNFTCGGEIASIVVPFVCKDCKNEQNIVFELGKLRELKFRMADVPCSRCGNKASFSEGKEYFSFMTETPSAEAKAISKPG